MPDALVLADSYDMFFLQFIPEDGIRIFGNALHTHLVGTKTCMLKLIIHPFISYMSIAGRGLTLQHFRMNSECGALEELEPIDQNLNYDFNFQQFTHLPKEHVVLPVSTQRGCSGMRC